MNIPTDLRYSSDHEWIRAQDGIITLGITEYAQDALGDVVYVQIPEQGTVVAAGDGFTEVESTKSVSDIYAPVSGTVRDVNDALEDSPELLNNDPYGDGWICTIEMSAPSELEELMSADQYRALTEGEG